MQGITEEEYAMKFCMLIILDERKVTGMDKYAENFKYILESYKKVIVNHPGLVIENASLEEGSDEFKNQAHMLTELCKVGNIGLILRQGSLVQSEMFSLLVEAIYRTLILVRFYALDGELTAEVLKKSYCSINKEISEPQFCRSLNISRATYYRRKQKGIMYAGYFFYEAVLPQMEGRI